MAAADNRVVSIHYTLRDEEGTVIDSSEGAEPLTYLHGAGNIIPGLEHALAGKAPGESLEVVVEPGEGYGEYQAELLQVVPRQAFEGVDGIEVGMAFMAESPDGSQRRIVVRDVEGDEITVDANHELAGVDLHFSVEVMSVREATDEEREQGQIA
ncbi:MAG: peptidylprolyl isomerase [Pseudomonadota bacterium]